MKGARNSDYDLMGNRIAGLSSFLRVVTKPMKTLTHLPTPRTPIDHAITCRDFSLVCSIAFVSHVALCWRTGSYSAGPWTGDVTTPLLMGAKPLAHSQPLAERETGGIHE